MASIPRSSRKFFWKVYAFDFVSEFQPIYAVYAVMFVQEAQLSTLAIGALVAAWSVTALVFEIPSGALADRHDRRYVLAAGRLLTAAGLALWLIDDAWQLYLVGFLLWGIGGACYSGTFEALVFDELKQQNISDRYVTLLGRTEAISLIAVVLAALIAAPLVSISYEVVLGASVVLALISAVIPLTFPKAPKQESVSEDESYVQTLKRGVNQANAHPLFFRTVILLSLGGGFADVIDEYGPLFVSDAGLAVGSVALFVAGAVSVIAIASAAAEHLPIPQRFQPLLLVAGALVMSFATTSDGFISYASYAVAAALIQVLCVLSRSDLQHNIASDLRATATSVAGFGNEVLTLTGLIGFGVLANATSRDNAFEWTAIVLLVAGLSALLGVQRRAREITPAQ